MSEAPEVNDIGKPAKKTPEALRVRTIRVKRETGPHLPSGPQPHAKKREKTARFGVRLKSRPVTVGVDIGFGYINLVKAAVSHNKFEILDYMRLPFPENAERGSEEFRDFFRSAAVPFCEHAGKKTEVWAITSSAQAHVQFVRIPKVPDRHFEAAAKWSLKKDIPLEEKDYSFCYEIQDEVTEGETKKNNVLCYFAPAREIEETKKLFSGIGLPLSGISIAPFAVQNIFMNDVTRLNEKQIACLFIGREHSRIDLYAGGKLALTRDIKTGINSLIEMLTGELHSKNMDAHFSHDEAQQILFALSGGVQGPIVLESGLMFNREEVEKMLVPVLERFTRQMERTFKHFDSTQGYVKVEKIYISSAMPCDAVAGYFSRHLGIECAVFDPLKEILPDSSPGERTALIPAFGLALSDNAHTPNFIQSYGERKKARYVTRFNRIVTAAMYCSLLLCLAFAAHEWRGAARAKAELARLEMQLEKSPPLNRQTLIRMTSASSLKAQQYAQLGRRYEGMALIGELSSRTPEPVRLISLKYLAGGQPNGQGSASAQGGNTAVVTGVVSGRRDMLDSELASYVMELRSSPLFSGVSVSEGKAGSAGERAFLPFELDLKVGPGK